MTVTYEQWLESRRYRVYRSDGRDWNNRQTMESGLKLDAALRKAAELQSVEDLANPTATAWGKTLFHVELETERWNPAMNTEGA